MVVQSAEPFVRLRSGIDLLVLVCDARCMPKGSQPRATALAVMSLALAGLAAANAIALVASLALVLWLLPTNGADRWFRLWVDRLAWWHVACFLTPVVLTLVCVLQTALAGGPVRAMRTALAALMIGLASGAFALIGGFFLVAGLRYKYDARLSSCIAHVTKLAGALQLYLADNDDRFPPATAWCGALSAYLPGEDVFTCPERPELACAYAFNSALSGVRYHAITKAKDTVAFFESDRGWDAAGGADLLPDRPRHLSSDTYGFADGHGAYRPRKKLPDGSWAKEPDADWVISEPLLKEDEGGAGP